MTNTDRCRDALGVLRFWLVRVLKTSPLGMVLVALLPKCPLCVAALLVTYGMAANIANVVAPWAGPALVIGVVTVAAISLPMLSKGRVRRDRSGGSARTRASIERAREHCC